MGEAWGDSDTVSHEVPGLPGAFVGRITNCQTGDTLTLPTGKIMAAFLVDETTADSLTWSISANVITIACTNNDEIDFLVFGVDIIET